MKEFRDGWRVVLVAMLGIAFGSGNITIYTIGMFTPELVREFNWSSSQVQFSLLMSTLGTLLGIPLVGFGSDKFGTRRIALGSVLLSTLGFMMYALMNDSLLIYYILTFLVSLLGAGTLSITWTRVLACWFNERRGLALGAALLGTGFGGAILKPIVAMLIAEVGWRGAYIGIGVLAVIAVLPLSLLWFKTPASSGSTDSDVHTNEGETMRYALHSWRFWVLGFSFFPIALAVGALIANMETILLVQGVENGKIVSIVTFIGIFVIVGRIGGGYLLDKFKASIVGATLIMLLAVACLLLANTPVTFGAAVLAVALLGLASGVEFDVLSFITLKFFGMKAYARIYGALLMFFYVGGAMGPVIFASVYDARGTYKEALVCTALGLVVSSVMMLSVGINRASPKLVAH